MLATLIDSHLTQRGQTRLCFVKALGVKDIDATLERFNRLLNEGTSNEEWLYRLADKLGLDLQKMIRANRVTVLMHSVRVADQPIFVPRIEFTFEGYDQPDSVMLLAKDQWQFNLPSVVSDDVPIRDFVTARQLYKRQFIASRGRCLGRRIQGFRYYWAKDQAIEFDIYGLVKVIVPTREPPKKRIVSRYVLRAVGKPKLLVIHNR